MIPAATGPRLQSPSNGSFTATNSWSATTAPGRKGKFAGANSRLSFDIWSGNFPRAMAKASNASHTGRSSHQGCAPQGPVSAEQREFSGWPLPAATAALLTPGLKGSSVKGQACLCRLTLPSVNLLVIQEIVRLSRLVPTERTPPMFYIAMWHGAAHQRSAAAHRGRQKLTASMPS